MARNRGKKFNVIFIVGGSHAGKRTFARNYFGLQDSDMADACIDERPCVSHAQELVRESEEGEKSKGTEQAEQNAKSKKSKEPEQAEKTEKGKESEKTIEALADELAKKRVVISDEVGCGIVPQKATERRWRERAGQLNCALATRADEVYRVVCGIPQRIKPSV